MKQPGNRDNSGRFVKGVSGNPSGRPQSLHDLKAFCMEHGLSRLKELVTDCWFQLKPSQRYDLVELMLAYAYGKPSATLNANVNVNDLTAEQREARFVELLAIAAGGTGGADTALRAGDEPTN